MHYILYFLVSMGGLPYSGSYFDRNGDIYSTVRTTSLYDNEDSCMKIVEQLSDPTSAVCIPVHGFVKATPSYKRY